MTHKKPEAVMAHFASVTTAKRLPVIKLLT